MFLHHLVEFANNPNFELVHKWHGINLLMILECLLILALFWASMAILAAIKGHRKFKIISVITSLFFATAAYAANTSLSNLSASGAIAAANLIYVVQTGGSGGVKATFTQVATFINSLFSGDATVAAGGAVTLATVNANVGSFGSATSCTTFTTNAKGLITAASQATCTPAIASITGMGTGVATFLATPSSANLLAALTTKTGTGLVMFGTLPDITTGFTIGGAATSGQYIRGDGAKFVSSAIQAADLPTLTVTVRTDTGTNQALPSSDQTKVVYLSNASANTPTIAQAGTGGFTAGWFATYCNIAAGIQTITPTTSTIGGAATLAIPAGSVGSPRCYNVISDGTNYTVVPAGNTYLISNGTSALGTSAIGSAACASAVTTSAPGVVTGDVIWWGFNGDPTAVTGYVPLTSGMLTIISYPSANNVNFKVCNNTTASITPGAITLNWRIVR